MRKGRQYSVYKATSMHARLWAGDLNDGSKFRTGGIMHPRGVVFVWASDSFTLLSFVWGGYQYSLQEERGHTRRGIAILAGRFVRDVIAGRVR